MTIHEPKVNVRPIRIHTPSAELHTTVCSGVGFRAVGSDGWRGPSRKTYAEARKDARLHRLEEQA